jgi:hypothetical protein
VTVVHAPVVLTSPGPWSSRSWAWCPCGWTSGLCQGLSTAANRADQHLRLKEEFA